MRGRRVEFVVYLVGVALLGLSQINLRAAIGQDGIAFAAVLAYLLALRFLGRAAAKRFSRQGAK